MAPKITLTSIMVDDQAKALRFYTEILGFVKKLDFPVGEFRWITVISPDGSPDVELAFEPIGFDFALAFQKGLYESGVPYTAFAVDDIQAEYTRLTQQGVVFRGEPTQQGPVTTAVFDDTCGNLIQLFQAN
jgi:catechol 2,3-dioxygenase-like lactoylglutathione lyase family enzyme